MKKSTFLAAVFFLKLMTFDLFAQKEIRTFIFGHSLLNHEFQINETPSQETAVPHWFHFLAEEAGHDYAVSGQYGFLPQHANLPPIAQWYFDYVPAAWESDYEPFTAANFNNILITPGNFIQWQGPSVNYFNEPFSPLDVTNTIFDWCVEQDDELVFYIYENWPDMGGYLNNGFPPTNDEWSNYNNYLNGDFHEWFLEYHDSLILDYPNSCIRMIPTGPIISKLLLQSPFDQIPIDVLYEDDAPHGRPTIYFLAALTTYMAMYEEKAPTTYSVDPIISPVVADNYQWVVDFIWDELNDFSDGEGDSRVFCDMETVADEEIFSENGKIVLSPNPTNDVFKITGLTGNSTIEIVDVFGRKLKIIKTNQMSEMEINITSFQDGIYFIKIESSNNSIFVKRIIKSK